MKTDNQGFTLLEVLLALAVVSIGIMALVQSAQTGAQATTALKEKTAAYHVADQAMMSLYQKPGLQVGVHQGEQLFAGENYYWQAEVKTTENQYINRIDLVVGTNRRLDHYDASLTGFKQRR